MLRQGQFLREEDAWMESGRLTLPLSSYPGKGVSLDDEGEFWIWMDQDRSCTEGCLQLVEC